MGIMSRGITFLGPCKMERAYNSQSQIRLNGAFNTLYKLIEASFIGRECKK